MAKPAPAPAATPRDLVALPAGGITDLERRALDLINEQRKAKPGCLPLIVDARLQTASREYAAKMVRTHRSDHQSVDGDGPGDRAKQAGFPAGVAENIMMGAPDDPEGLVNNNGWGWMQSQGHRDNIMDCNLNVAGIGYDPGLIDPHFASGSWVLMLGHLE